MYKPPGGDHVVHLCFTVNGINTIESFWKRLFMSLSCSEVDNIVNKWSVIKGRPCFLLETRHVVDEK